ncbi:hypothetical protein PUR34_30325 [Streptomyces sp. JV185]|uniref:hypothetical protein n=1 Tax=Streptomyces sp. JV185 TaxID=858638 RepID=UPI002E76EB4E|nr:hypothetical protein [Streptomyces sp. JV185]MEE1772350.1 hypothetical protein [Streptomyces sp. JV185]
MVAGYFGKGVDRAVGLATNSLLAVPPLILLIALAAVLEPLLRNVARSPALLTQSPARDLRMATVLISHDLATVADRTDRVAVMYSGSLVEYAPSASVFDRPRHTRTAAP